MNLSLQCCALFFYIYYIEAKPLIQRRDLDHQDPYDARSVFYYGYMLVERPALQIASNLCCATATMSITMYVIGSVSLSGFLVARERAAVAPHLCCLRSTGCHITAEAKAGVQEVEAKERERNRSYSQI